MFFPNKTNINTHHSETYEKNQQEILRKHTTYHRTSHANRCIVMSSAGLPDVLSPTQQDFLMFSPTQPWHVNATYLTTKEALLQAPPHAFQSRTGPTWQSRQFEIKRSDTFSETLLACLAREGEREPRSLESGKQAYTSRRHWERSWIQRTFLVALEVSPETMWNIWPSDIPNKTTESEEMAAKTNSKPQKINAWCAMELHPLIQMVRLNVEESSLNALRRHTRPVLSFTIPRPVLSLTTRSFRWQHKVDVRTLYSKFSTGCK